MFLRLLWRSLVKLPPLFDSIDQHKENNLLYVINLFACHLYSVSKSSLKNQFWNYLAHDYLSLVTVLRWVIGRLPSWQGSRALDSSRGATPAKLPVRPLSLTGHKFLESDFHLGELQGFDPSDGQRRACLLRAPRAD